MMVMAITVVCQTIIFMLLNKEAVGWQYHLWLFSVRKILPLIYDVSLSTMKAYVYNFTFCAVGESIHLKVNNSLILPNSGVFFLYNLLSHLRLISV